VSDAAFGCPDLTTFCRLDELGLVVVGQRLEPDRAVLACRVLEADDGIEGWCRRCGCVGRPRDTVTRELAHGPVGKAAFKAWLTQRPQAWREAVEVVAMDGFTGFKTAAAEEIPAAVAVMDPFHVVRLAGDALNDCRRRVQQTTRDRRGRKNDPLYRARRTLHTGADLLTDKQAARLTALFAIDEHVEVEATWGIYQRMIAAYRHPDPAAGRELMVKLIESLSAGVPRPLVEIAKLGRTLGKRAADVLAYFDRPGTSNGPTEAINGRLEHLRGSALGFRNLTNYIARSLLETGGFRPRLHPALVKSRSSWGSAKDTTETGNQ
jgi:hypothetical protein